MLARKSFQKVWIDRCDSTISDLMAPTAVAQMPSGSIQGIDAFIQFRDELLSAFPDMSVTVHDTVCEGDRVVTWWKVKTTHRSIRGNPENK